MKVAVSWSGGKDSCFACYKALSQGYQVSHLMNFISREANRISFHDIDRSLIQAQSQATGIPLVQSGVAEKGGDYEQVFKDTLRELKVKGVEGLVCGDIDVQEHRDWLERVCGAVEVEAIFPLWQQSREEIVNQFINSGFEAVVVSAKAEFFDSSWIGRKIDRGFLQDLRKSLPQVDLCGEFGEFHTLVVAGPLFHRRIHLLETEPVLKNGFYTHWLLEILRYELR